MTNREYIESFNDEAFLKFMSWFGNGKKYICTNYAGRDTDYKKIVNWYGEKYDENSDFWQFIQPTIDKVSNWRKTMNVPIAKPLDDRYKLAIIDLEKDVRDLVNIMKAKAAYEKGLISNDEFRDVVLNKNEGKYV